MSDKIHSLFDRFCSLDLPTGNKLSACEYNDSIYLAKNNSNHAIFLIEVAVREPEIQQFNTTYIKSDYLKSCKIILNDSQELEENFYSISFASSSKFAKQLFIGIFKSWFEDLGRAPTVDEINLMLSELSAIFREKPALSPKKLQGLYAEVLIIHLSRSADYFVKIWKSGRNTYDFADGISSLEVKSYSGPDRQHRFSVNQLTQRNSRDTRVASLYIEQSDTGLSLSDLIENIVKKCTAENSSKLLKIITDTIGANNLECLEHKFNQELASDRLKFFDLLSIPSIPTEYIDNRISDLSYQVNLGGFEEVDDKTKHKILAEF